MDILADGKWRKDESIEANNLFIGVARDPETLNQIGVVIALTVKTRGKPITVTAVIPPSQAIEVCDSITLAVRDIELST